MSKQPTIPEVLLNRGPDVFRGMDCAVAFVLTPYTDENGENFFSRPNGEGHEAWSTAPNMIRAMFGPALNQSTEAQRALVEEAKNLPCYHWKKKKVDINPSLTLYDELRYRTEIYIPDVGGYKATGKYREGYRWDAVRFHSSATTIYGRTGRIHRQTYIMVWPIKINLNDKIPYLLDRLAAPKDAVLVIGKDQYRAKDFSSNDK